MTVLNVLNMKNILLLLIILLIINNCCAQDNQTESNWLFVEYNYSNGPVPPKYQYRYTIKIDNKMNGSIRYSFAYDSSSKKYVETINFTIDEERMKLIDEAIINSKVTTEKIESLPPEEIPKGGHIKYLRIAIPTENDETKLIKVTSNPSEKYSQALNYLYNLIYESVPDNILKDLNQKRAEYKEKHKQKN